MRKCEDSERENGDEEAKKKERVDLNENTKGNEG